MKFLEDIDLSIALCRQELDDLKQHLDNKNELKERRDVLPFFRERSHLSVFIGSYFPYIDKFDRIAIAFDGDEID
ncbi:MAG: hypothetical protein JJU32_10700 [Phormidium sp. BM_Day4_Bin.17]|nr:hypothetical protein [Phormidium sp. BM_Day4_Bin.17]UCJ11020.1 MAG: hypothetical protein JWS08_14530 [Phormidium sp. PBR-2020]